MNLSTKLAVPSQVMARPVGDETIILDLASGTYFGLDPVGARIWQLIGEGHPLTEVCDRLLTEYDVERAQLEADVLRLIQELLDRGLVSVP